MTNDDKRMVSDVAWVRTLTGHPLFSFALPTIAGLLTILLAYIAGAHDMPFVLCLAGYALCLVVTSVLDGMGARERPATSRVNITVSLFGLLLIVGAIPAFLAWSIRTDFGGLIQSSGSLEMGLVAAAFVTADIVAVRATRPQTGRRGLPSTYSEHHERPARGIG